MRLIACGYRVTTFESTGPDEQVIKRDNDSSLNRFGVNLSNQLCRFCRNRMDGYRGLQIVEEGTARLAACRGISAMDTVRELGHAD